MISFGDGSEAASASHLDKCLRAIASCIPVYKLCVDQHAHYRARKIGCLPESFASKERVENTAIFNMNLARKENPAPK